MAIQKEIWAADIAEKLFPDSSFVVKSVDDTPFVEGKKVHRASSGAKPAVERNRAVVPATGVQRTDEDAEYDIDEYTSTPTIIRNIEEVEVNYDKRASVLRGHIESLNEQSANWIGYNWAPSAAGAITRTTGDARTAIAAGGTGNRKKITIDDVLKLKRLLDFQDVPLEGRFLLLPSEMYNDLLTYQDIRNQLMMGVPGLPEGAIGRLFGMNVMMRSYTPTYTNDATPAKRTPDAAALITANAAAIAWGQNFVTRAKGEVLVFDDIDNPTVYGSIFSALLRAGGRQYYKDGTGVAALVEAAA